MCGLSIWSTIFNKQPFNPNDLGVGVGGLLGGVAGVLIGVGGYLFGQGRAVSINESSGVTTGTTVQPQTGTITNFTSSGQSSNINMARPIPIVPDTPTGSTGSTGSPDSNDSKQVQIG